MTPEIIERALWGGTVVSVCVAILGWRFGTAQPAADVGMHWDKSPAVLTPAVDSVADAAVDAAEHDPFRLARHPSSVAYGTAGPATAASPTPPGPARPTLGLTGTVGGPPWEALIEGIPGHGESIIAHVGDTLVRDPTLMVIRSIRRDTAIVRETHLKKDSTWMLTVKRPW